MRSTLHTYDTPPIDHKSDTEQTAKDARIRFRQSSRGVLCVTGRVGGEKERKEYFFADRTRKADSPRRKVDLYIGDQFFFRPTLLTHIRTLLGEGAQGIPIASCRRRWERTRCPSGFPPRLRRPGVAGLAVRAAVEAEPLVLAGVLGLLLPCPEVALR